jgi:hypothetical protein
MVEAKVQKVPTGNFHPCYGCAILILAFLVFGGLVTWTLYSGWEQDRQISTFSETSPKPTQLATPTTEEKDLLKARLAEFSSASKTGPAKLTMTVSDLNTLLILSLDVSDIPQLKEAKYPGMVWFTAMDEKAQMIKADVCLTLHGLPFIGHEKYLVAHAAFKPEIGNTGLEFHIDNVEVPGKTVPEGFMFQMRTLPWLNLVKLKPEFADLLKRVTSAQVTPEGALVLEAKPAAPAK